MIPFWQRLDKNQKHNYNCYIMAANTQFSLAIHILTILALRPDTDAPKEQRVCSEQIAHSVDTHPVVVRRLMHDLVKEGLVLSHPGKGGGLTLGRPANEITLLDIYTAMGHSDVVAFKAHVPNETCPIGHQMLDVLAPIFCDVENRVRQRLAQTTLDDIVHELKDGHQAVS